MITYNALSAVQIFTFFTGSEHINHFLTATQYDFVKHNPKYLPEYPLNTKEFVNSTAPAGLTYCLTINPYAYFVGMWNNNTVYRTKNNITPYTFTEYTNDYVNQHTTSPVVSGRYAPITVQLTTANFAREAVQFLKVENIAEDIKKFPKIDLTNPVQLSAYNRFIVNGAVVHGNDLSWKTHYNQALADLVYSTNFVSDFNIFGYTQDSWN